MRTPFTPISFYTRIQHLFTHKLLVSNTSRLPPVYVRAADGLTDSGLFGGISTRTGHMGARSDCLNDMLQLFATHNAQYNSHLPSSFSFSFSSSLRGQQQQQQQSVEELMRGLLRSNRFVAGRASSWTSNQPATFMEFLATVNWRRRKDAIVAAAVLLKLPGLTILLLDCLPLPLNLFSSSSRID